MSHLNSFPHIIDFPREYSLLMTCFFLYLYEYKVIVEYHLLHSCSPAAAAAAVKGLIKSDSACTEQPSLPLHPFLLCECECVFECVCV